MATSNTDFDQLTTTIVEETQPTRLAISDAFFADGYVRLTVLVEPEKRDKVKPFVGDHGETTLEERQFRLHVDCTSSIPREYDTIVIYDETENASCNQVMLPDGLEKFREYLRQASPANQPMADAPSELPIKPPLPDDPTEIWDTDEDEVYECLEDAIQALERIPRLTRNPHRPLGYDYTAETFACGEVREILIDVTKAMDKRKTGGGELPESVKTLLERRTFLYDDE